MITPYYILILCTLLFGVAICMEYYCAPKYRLQLILANLTSNAKAFLFSVDWYPFSYFV